MRYELTVIVPGDLDEKDAGARITGVKEALVKHGATEIKEQLLGRQPLAYPINRQTQGYYAIWDFDAIGAAVGQVERDLKLGGQVIRWLTVQAYKNPYKVVETPKLAEDARSAEELLRRTSGTEPTKKRPAKVETETVETPEAEGEREKKLDEALEKLLSDDQDEPTKE